MDVFEGVHPFVAAIDSIARVGHRIGEDDVAIGIDRGADVVRVHDVKAIVRVARMTDAIVRR